jgi:hypothetical protein
MTKKIIFLVLAFYSFNLFSQGCSDAGFCSLGNITPHMDHFQAQKKVNMMRLGFSYGRGLRSLNVYNPYLEYTRIVNDHISFNTRINFMAHAGNDIQTGEIGDVYFTGDFKLAPKFKTVVGFKVPLQQGDKVKRGINLPMDYQNTLGTLDFLWALQTNVNNFHLAMGWQIPLTQNANKFFTTDFVSSEEFPTTNGFIRNPDVWMRVSYPIHVKNWSFIPNLLPIYHLGNDTYKDEFGVRKPILGSRGLTFNADIQIDYKLCENNIIGLNLAAPFITRDIQPEGMGRKYVFTLDYRKSF